MGRSINSTLQAGAPAALLSPPTSVQEGMAIAVNAWDEIFPAAFLLASLVLQLVLLITGELRKFTSKVTLLAWLAYVGGDLIASFLLGLLFRKTLHLGLWGLWSALLIYHLGGPDNFTAYERADSELWIRHLLYLVLQVVTAAYVIAANTRGFFLVPTLLVFVVGVIRYYERNHALKWSSRSRLNEEMAPIYEYMKYMQPNNRNGGPPSLSSDHEQLQLFVAGAAEWHQSKTAAGSESRDLVTTEDIFDEMRSTNFTSQDYCRRACELCVAFASSFAYLRRVVALSRLEQSIESSQSKMRRLWFMNDKFFTSSRDWLAYIHLERDFLYNWLYAKPLHPDTYLSRLVIRIACSVALFAALVLVILHPTYDHADADEVWGTAHARVHARLEKDVTYVVLAVGFLVEIAYLLRLLASKRAVVAILVAVVRTQRRRRSPRSQGTGGSGFSYLRSGCSIIQSNFTKIWASFVLLTCKLSLVSNNFFEKRFVIPARKGTYLPPSNFFYRLFSTWRWLRHITVTPPPRGWDQMYQAVWSRNDSSFQSQLQGIRAQETPALDRVLELIEIMVDYTVHNTYFSHGEPRKPIHMRESLDIFVVYYDSNWETVLLVWWIGTLKVLILEQLQRKQILQDGASPRTADQPGRETQPRRSNVQQAAESAEDTRDHVVQVINAGELAKEIDSISSKEMKVPTGSVEGGDSTCMRQSDESAGVEDLRNRALWLMAYVSHLLTACPELLPTHVELTKTLVAKEVEHVHSQITNDTNWMEATRRKVESMKLPAVKLEERRAKEAVGETIARLRKVGLANVDQRDVDNDSTELAVLLVDCMSLQDRWALIEGSAAHFVASLANSAKTVDQCAKLTHGGELLTFLWILVSHLGGGST